MIHFAFERAFHDFRIEEIPHGIYGWIGVYRVKCRCFEIKSRDMNEKEKNFIFYNKPYMPSAGLHGPLHMAMVCALSLSLLLP